MENNAKSTTKNIILAIKWLFSVLFFIFFIGSLTDKAITSAIFFFIALVILLPLLTATWNKIIPFLKNVILKFIISFVLVILGVSTNPEIEKPEFKQSKIVTNEQLKNLDATKKKSAKKEKVEFKKNKVEFFDLERVYYNSDGNRKYPDSNDVTYEVVETLEHSKNEAREAKFNSENIHLLIEASSYKKEHLKTIAFQVKEQYAVFAPDNCNIQFWDDKAAYELFLDQQKYYTETFDELMKEYQQTREPYGEKYEKLKTEWDQKNYPFIADHQPMSITNGSKFSFYPLQDSYYKDLGGDNIKK